MLDALAGLVRRFPDDRAHLTSRERLDLATRGLAVASQVQGLAAQLVAEADAANASLKLTGTPLATYLATHTNVSARQGAGTVHQSNRLASHPVACRAVVDGQISAAHGQAVGRAMEQLPDTFTDDQMGQAELLLVEIAGRTTPDRVEDAASKIAAIIDPADADQREQTRLAQERDVAWTTRSLSWRPHHGSIQFSGSLPVLEGTAFTTIIDAFALQARRDALSSDTGQQATGGTDGPDLHTAAVSLNQRRADALVALVEAVDHHRSAPTLAGDRPTVTVLLDYDKLMAQAAGAGVLPDGTPLSAGDLRRVCCDANLIPVVLGTHSEPLDVGRANRFVTGPLRKAITVRDRHCQFPSCDTPAHRCDVHHILPWQEGGETNLDNLVLVCPHHHGIVEPDPYRTRDQWRVEIGPDGHPVFHPPRGYQDPGPFTHTITPPPRAGPAPPG